MRHFHHRILIVIPASIAVKTRHYITYSRFLCIETRVILINGYIEGTPPYVYIWGGEIVLVRGCCCPGELSWGRCPFPLISWFPRLRFCTRCRNLTITITKFSNLGTDPHKN